MLSMKKNFVRTGIALLISSTGFLLTVVWFKLGKDAGATQDRKPVARLDNSSNEVQRKPRQRVIWESINKNDELYAGETVRTAPNAEAQLYFEKSKTMVHLDPDSLVVLEENEKGLSLDFLQGNLFVQSNATDGKDGLTLKSGDKEIKLKSADMSLSRAENGNVNLEVHRGEAQVNQGNKTTSLNKDKSAELSDKDITLGNDRMQLIHPTAGEVVFLNLTRGEKVDLNWKPLPSAYQVTVEIGENRSKLEKVSGLNAAGASGTLNLIAKPGRWYLRLVANSSDSKLPPLASSVVPFRIQPKSSPALVEPLPDAHLLHKEPGVTTGFKWINRNEYTAQVLEVSNDSQFKGHVIKENLTPDILEFAKELPDGSYFWRVTGFLAIKGKSESLTSPVFKFSVDSKWEIKPPELLSPNDKQHLSFVDVQKSGVALKWRTPLGVEKTKVLLEKQTGEVWKKVYNEQTETSVAGVSDLTPGHYRWKAESLDSKGAAAPKSSPTFTFTVEDMPKIDWVSNEGPDIYFTSNTPSLTAHWKPTTGAFSYRYRVVEQMEDAPAGEWHETKQTQLDQILASEGSFQAQVEALNASGQLVGQSDPKVFQVKRRPLLAAPQWLNSTPDVLKADGKGNLSFSWEQVNGAEHYLMILEDAGGSVLQKKEVARAAASLNRLKPGQYQVHMVSVDGFKREGVNGSKRKVEVPQTSDIRAPKIKAMKVK